MQIRSRANHHANKALVEMGVSSTPRETDGMAIAETIHKAMSMKPGAAEGVTHSCEPLPSEDAAAKYGREP